MLRYLALATAIVLGACLIVVALPRSHRDAASRYSSDARATAGPARHDESRATGTPVGGDAPWALSALPECFVQRASRRGSVAYARVLLAGARPLASGTVLHVADCTLVLRGDFATVTRGENHLRIPPPARFFALGNATIVERRDGARDDVRLYVPRGERSRPSP
ncbi:MAG: hypothetical protein NVS3B17_01850 [Vulcanimicrobiaceae bacterium]